MRGVAKIDSLHKFLRVLLTLYSIPSKFEARYQVVFVGLSLSLPKRTEDSIDQPLVMQVSIRALEVSGHTPNAHRSRLRSLPSGRPNTRLFVALLVQTWLLKILGKIWQVLLVCAFVMHASCFGPCKEEGSSRAAFSKAAVAKGCMIKLLQMRA